MLPDFHKRTALLRGTHVPTGCSDKVIFENKEDIDLENANYAEKKFVQ